MDIYIRVNKSNVVEFVSTTPMDPKEGLGMTREELELQGKFVSDIPEPNTPAGQKATMMYNPDTNSIYYKYEPVPLPAKKRLDNLENAMNVMIENMMKDGVNNG